MICYDRTLTSACTYAKAGRLEEWIHLYLLSDGNNVPFSEGLKDRPRTYFGPVQVPIGMLHRCCGPEEHMTWRVHPGHFEDKVNRLMEAIRSDPDMPPLIACYRFSEADGTPEFELNDGNGRYEAYTRLGYQHVNVVFWITEDAEVKDFLRQYGSLFEQKET